MDFDLSREQEMIRKEVHRFAESEIAPLGGEWTIDQGVKRDHLVTWK